MLDYAHSSTKIFFVVVVKHGYFILVIYKLYLMAENLKSWARGKLVQKWKIKPKGYTDKP